MALKRLQIKPGVDKENTRYATEGSWYDSDKIRFRSGTPEVVGGWRRISTTSFLGICRSLFNWVTLTQLNLMAVGTNRKYYIEDGGVYNDVTPLRATTALPNNPFTATNGSAVITVNAPTHGALAGDFVTFSGATGLGGNITAAVLNREYEIATVVNVNSYTFVATATANATDAAGSPGGGAAVNAAYQLSGGSVIQTTTSGWGAGAWGSGSWGLSAGVSGIRLWSQAAFGEDLILCPRGGAPYYWDASGGTASRAVALSSLSGASNVPTLVATIGVSDVSRFVLAFGANEIGSAALDPLLVRWSDQESAVNWTPAATNQAGFIRLSLGSEIVTALQTRQEWVVWTNSTVYSMQYVGPPVVWSTSMLATNISIAGPNAATNASGMVFWMGMGSFYKYDGRVQAINCTLNRHVFGNFNFSQAEQAFAGTNEEFHEIWWFYCSENSTSIDRYVIYNYLEGWWANGTMARTAWLDSELRDRPVAATYSSNLVTHEEGVDDIETGTPTPINARIESAEFDIEDGEKFAFVWRLLPDVTFDGSTAGSPTLTMTLTPLRSSGSGYSSPASEGGNSSQPVVRSAVVPVERYTGQVNIRVRGRQMTLKVESNQLGCTWQLGTPRIDIRPDGRRG